MTPGTQVDAEYLYYSLLLASARIASLAGEQAVPIINKSSFSANLIAVPSLPEQRAIAAALGDADALIAALEALIAKKRDLKQAAMQQLLTGKTRLLGFGSLVAEYKPSEVGQIPADWDALRLGSGISLLSGHHVLARYCHLRLHLAGLRLRGFYHRYLRG